MVVFTVDSSPPYYPPTEPPTGEYEFPTAEILSNNFSVYMIMLGFGTAAIGTVVTIFENKRKK